MTSTNTHSIAFAPLDALRAAMHANGIHACLVPSADPHMSEYLPAHWQIRQWLTGFTGSVGTVVVTQAFAGLWVDSRYWVQAEAELAGTGFSLMKTATAADPSHTEWLAHHLPQGATLAVDGRALSMASRDALAGLLHPRGIALLLDIDLPGLCWHDRPALPAQPVRELSVDLAGESRAQKLARLRESMRTHSAQWHLISTLDDLAWLFNLRGEDVDFNPVFLGHALVGYDHATIFVGQGKISAELERALLADGIRVAPYETTAEALRALAESDNLLVDPARVCCALADATAAHLVRTINPTQFFKSRKSAFELSHVRRIMEIDGAALCNFFAWLDSAIDSRTNQPLTELEIDQAVTQARARHPDFVSRSFGTIAAYNANGAMPHYRATPRSHARIAGDGLLLIDSGGQYRGGTTDITRVVPVGHPTRPQMEDYTAVLRAMIALSRLRFPRGVPGPSLDAVARAPLWDRLAEYGHGTGHGVGYYLNVHEGPQVISYRAAPAPHTAMQPGMITSNEPGLYRPGRWGVRIENLICTRIAGESEFGEFLEFETLTLCPIDTRCVLPEQMRPDEIDWLNAYHAQVRQRLSPMLEGAGLQWLLQRTEPILSAQIPHRRL